MSDLLTKSLAYYDPTILRGRTADGVVLGMIGMRGRCQRWPAGGYVLKRGTSRDAITEIVGAAGPAATSIREFAFVGHAPSTTYYYQVVPVGPAGVEAVVGSYGVVAVAFGVDGLAAAPPPPAPRELQAAAIAGGKFRLRWVGGLAAGRPRATSFRIYHDAGTGTMDWATSIATVPAAGGAAVQGYLTAAYAHGAAVQFGVRARAGSSNEEANVVVVTATADAEGPADAAVQSATIGADQ